MRKYFIFLLFMVLGCVWDHSPDQEEELIGLEEKADIFTVTVGAGSVDCHLPTLIFTEEDSTRIANLSGESGRIYMAYHLEPEFNEQGRSLKVTVRNPRVDETVICTAMGPMYPMVFVTRAEWVE